MIARKLPVFLNLFLFHFCIANCALAQVKPPQITPLSPNAAALWKYAEFPVNMYTGIPSISIPIYEVKSGNLSVPISLSYHAGGNRYEDQASWVGLGWNLNAGGAVNRNVKGKADEKQSVGIFTQSQPINLQIAECDLEYFTNVNNGNIDTQPDEFTFSIPGKSGRFIYKQTVAEPLIMPYEPIKITKTYSPGNLSAFQIIDETGIIYRLGNNKLLNNPVTESTSGGIGSSIEETTPYPGSWLLTEMESADGSDVISFNYVAGQSWVQKNSRASSVTVTETLINNSYSIGSVVQQNFSFLTNTKYFSEILFENGKVEFVQTSWYRTDLYNNQRALEAINIYSKVDGVYILIKKVVFTYSYFKRKFHNVLQDWKLKLNKVQVFGKNSQLAEEYSFDYHTDNFSGDEYYFPPYAIDYWGFYNGKTNNTSLIPVQTFSAEASTTAITTGNADRSVDPVFMIEGVLKKITYPTGGYTTFEFEPHQYLENGVLTYAGGLRIKKITSSDATANGKLEEKNYKYGINESGDGYQNFYNNFGFYSTSSFGPPVGGKATTISSTQSFQLDGFDGTPVVYPYVTEYHGNTTSNNGKIKYVYDNGSPVQDNLIIKYYPYTNLFFRKTNHWKRGLLTQKTVFDKNNNKVSEQSNSYQILHPMEEFIGVAVQKKFFWDATAYYPYGPCKYSHSPGVAAPNENGCTISTGGGMCFNVWHFVYLPFATGNVKLLKTTETVYSTANPADATTTETSYVYDNNYLQPLEVNKSLFKLQTGYEEHITNFAKYPFNYSFTGTPSGADAEGIKLLQDKNMSAVPIEQYTVRKFKDPTVWQSYVTAGNITTYRNDKPYPSKVWQIEAVSPILLSSFSGSTITSNAFSKSPDYEEKIEFTGYDTEGNITQYNKAMDVNHAYIWDYQSQYPIAEASNASLSNIAYTSFEADGEGNWTFSGTVVADLTAPTGKKAYNLTTGGLSKTVTAANTYIVSYWRPTASSALTITGTAAGYPITGRTVNGWKYYEHKVTGVSSAQLTGTGLIDEVRLYPEDAQMATYTYEPLTGMSSQCDANNRISYFEYNNSQRLVLIRDQDRNIVKKICYNYAGQPENCQLYVSDNKSGTYTRSNCGPGYTPGSVYVNVPAGSFTSAASVAEANTQATAYGQQQANANGTCTANCSFNMAAGYTKITSGLSPSGSTVSFYLVFSSSGVMTSSYPDYYNIATITGACIPGNYRVLTVTESGRTWEVIIYANGQLKARLTSANATVSAGQGVTLSGTYNL